MVEWAVLLLFQEYARVCPTINLKATANTLLCLLSCGWYVDDDNPAAFISTASGDDNVLMQARAKIHVMTLSDLCSGGHDGKTWQLSSCGGASNETYVVDYPKRCLTEFRLTLSNSAGKVLAVARRETGWWKNELLIETEDKATIAKFTDGLEDVVFTNQQPDVVPNQALSFMIVAARQAIEMDDWESQDG
eukprot:TRINITY_DN23829_c0_g1_i12.p1 TRINITY_DN23829_c0_g1~~TRINITY_DN23829_c0_g1_i12.p1  ORF type:complete len:191 (+),score=26.91 TRINITY_DN23829_c0_g1_i12:695-1267(+)